ncbi:putative component of NuA3 histone acetyltransferase complex [Coemansia interrupta]|uniref:Component of NuA3 histone acetyltransferase complex n=1 Tax=Coemansia interrupta TaxID=1126814 RepID=A0A9W8HMN4_9FUNG|nr:putative component of NuA3 histone acetyltransferase complex [Coemansia interrupta]
MPENNNKQQAVPDDSPNSGDSVPSAEKRARTSMAASVPSVQTLGINQWYLSDEFMDAFCKAFTNTGLEDPMFSIKQEQNDGEGIIVSSPFHTGKLRSIFPKKFLHGLKNELSELNWHERLNDLYWFHQTDDLALNGRQHIKALRDYLSGEEFVGFMERITGTELARGYLDLAAQRYKKGNHLLCHDDDVHRGKLTRKIAYIIYLVDEGWSDSDGGALGLFDSDKNRYPTEVVSRILPEFNSIGFFLTGMVSYHTVEEVTVSKHDQERWSVTGWFYGPATSDNTSSDDNGIPPLPSSVLPQVLLLDESPLASEDQTEWAKWINTDYLSQAIQCQIQATFLEQSSVELRDFLRPEVYTSLVSSLGEPFWDQAQLRGPAHLRRYLEAEPASDCSVVNQLSTFFKSASFGRLLAALTSLDFVSASQQIRKFKHGHYTLIHDQAIEPAGLDAVLSIQNEDPEGGDASSSEWDETWGGAIHYIADKDELLRVSPEKNSLSLVLRDEGTLRFVKYLNHMAPRERQDISMVFIEKPSSDDGEDASE